MIKKFCLLYGIITMTVAAESVVDEIPSKFGNYLELNNYLRKGNLDYSVSQYKIDKTVFYCCIRDLGLGGSLQEVAIYKMHQQNLKLVMYMPFSIGEKRFLNKNQNIIVQQYSKEERKFIDVVNYLP